MFGRLYSYKNVDVVLEGWQRHVVGGGWRSDNLVLIGDGSLDTGALPKHTRWLPGWYRYSDVITTLAAAKGSVAHYRRASQSGVQVLSMQLGVMPIVSTAGGLPEYQPPGFPPVGVDELPGSPPPSTSWPTRSPRQSTEPRQRATTPGDSPSIAPPIACWTSSRRWWLVDPDRGISMKLHVNLISRRQGKWCQRKHRAGQKFFRTHGAAWERVTYAKIFQSKIRPAEIRSPLRRVRRIF